MDEGLQVWSTNALRSARSRAEKEDCARKAETKTNDGKTTSRRTQDELALVKDPEGNRKGKTKPGVLDGFLLLEGSHVEFPDQATRADLNGRSLEEVVEEDLQYYQRLSFLDVGENKLSIELLTNLRALEELRLQCNAMQSISGWRTVGKPFPMLLVLDLSYNQLETDAVEKLTEIPRLRELDLTCNDIHALPPTLEGFKALEVLLLGQNKIHRPECIRTLSKIPRLKELDLSENRIRHIPEDVDFPRLEWLSLVDNKIRTQQDVEALLSVPELNQVLLYGNPISQQVRSSTVSTTRGSSHFPEESTVYIGGDDESESAIQIGDQWDDREVINVVTDGPSAKPTTMARKKAPKLKGMYSHFQIAKIKEVEMKTNAQWRAMGNQMLFGTMSKQEESDSDETSSQSSFDDEEEIDEPNQSTRQEQSEGKEEQEAESKTQDNRGNHESKQDDNNNHNNRESVFLTEPSLFDTFERFEGEREEQEEREAGNKPTSTSLVLTSTQALREELASYLDNPSSLSSGPSQRKRSSNPNKLRHAMHALRYALKHPLTSHNDIPADDNDGEQEAGASLPQGGLGYLGSKNLQSFSTFSRYEKSTLVSKMKQKPKVPYQQSQGKRDDGVKLRHERVPLGLNKKGQKSYLDSIERVLDRMEFNKDCADELHHLHNPSYQDESERTVEGLIGLVNSVMDNFEK